MLDAILAGLGALPLAGAIGGSLATPKSHAAATVKTQAKIGAMFLHGVAHGMQHVHVFGIGIVFREE